MRKLELFFAAGAAVCALFALTFLVMDTVLPKPTIQAAEPQKFDVSKAEGDPNKCLILIRRNDGTPDYIIGKC